MFFFLFKTFLYWGGGGCNPKKKRKKPVPNLKFAVAFVFFRYFSVFFGFLWYFFGFFFGLNYGKKFQSFKNHVNNEVLGGQELPNNTLNAYKVQQMSHESYYNKQEPLNKNPLNQSKFTKMEKPKKNRKKTEKKPKKTSPKFEICGSVRFFLGCNPPPPPPPHLFLCSIIIMIDCYEIVNFSLHKSCLRGPFTIKQSLKMIISKTLKTDCL